MILNLHVLSVFRDEQAYGWTVDLTAVSKHSVTVRHLYLVFLSVSSLITLIVSQQMCSFCLTRSLTLMCLCRLPGKNHTRVSIEVLPGVQSRAFLLFPHLNFHNILWLSGCQHPEDVFDIWSCTNKVYMQDLICSTPLCYSKGFYSWLKLGFREKHFCWLKLTRKVQSFSLCLWFGDLV